MDMVNALSGSLRQLQLQNQQKCMTDTDKESETGDSTIIAEEQRSPKRPLDGYGFRKSGMSTPLLPAPTPDGPHSQSVHELVPDPNGLGWPGVLQPLMLQHQYLF